MKPVVMKQSLLRGQELMNLLRWHEFTRDKQSPNASPHHVLHSRNFNTNNNNNIYYLQYLLLLLLLSSQ